ncbi:MAG: hypothetical protein H0W30_05305 [Gemmatimonadaceae bacterium]|nr:hypothetical protein [Gemmatimonadaceae bacterium]
MASSDLSNLPPDLAEKSLSKDEIMLGYEDAVRAVDHIARGGHRIEAWEGWVQMPEGARTHSLAHPGSFALPMQAGPSAEAARSSMAEAHAAWEHSPEYPNASLYFSLTVASE